jgi:formylglycine-generating enzyme required for sulfatase activity
MLIAFKLKLALACAAGFAAPLAVAPLVSDPPARDARPPAQEIIELKSGNLSYRLAGDFTRAGQPVEAPLRRLTFTGPLAIMKRQVSAAEYQMCVDDGACRAMDRDVTVATDRPAVQVNWHDASAYAAWLSRRTGDTYRLPTDEEWAFAAGGKFADYGLPADGNDPARRWIARYERESTNGNDSATRAFGAFGANENGLLDFAGNVWEWTATCFVRSVLDEAGATLKQSSNCGVRIAEGRHRAYVTDFIRDARAGGCAAGPPPSNLGFRLVREPKSWIGALASSIGKAAGIARS